MRGRAAVLFSVPRAQGSSQHATVYDQTHLEFARRGHVIPASLLKPNDLIVAQCELALSANPLRGPPSYHLVADDIGFVHAADDHSTGIKLVLEEVPGESK
ncbi:hypothetical protein OH77DRAFT_233731 [Trametes cingulata]|nr:hypothetical protein OH77DRAFT_233731 [Trametes cingulata]